MKWLMWAVILVAAVAMVAIIMASLEPHLDHGVVVSKQHTASYTTFIPISAGNGVTTLVPIVQPERYTLYLRDGDTTGSTDVEPDTYSKYHEGDTFP